ncbi:unnamed protein product [Trifolium pratense]|uniref:Uncharacterized protein n=1 Tax=Trifolium pratense TaxID=57577 RepID=A0ACB0I6V2_TRIPR|nr:unnamed protein product [Trifolium pratense]
MMCRCDLPAHHSDLNQRRGSRNFENLYSNTSPDYLPFEFRALEVSVEAACTFLDTQSRGMLLIAKKPRHHYFPVGYSSLVLIQNLQLLVAVV